jgi:hypothetical protein
MHLDLTEEETSETIENDRYLLSPRVQTLRGIIASSGRWRPLTAAGQTTNTTGA